MNTKLTTAVEGDSMDGQQSGGASLRGRGRPTRLPDTVTVKAPGGTRNAIEKAARSRWHGGPRLVAAIDPARDRSLAEAPGTSGGGS